MPRPPPSLKAKALACIALREHSRVELRRKLLAHAERLAQAAMLAGQSSAKAPEGSEGHAPAIRSGAHDADLTELGPVQRSRERSRVGAERHATEVDALLDWLESKDLLSAQRFVEMRVQVRSQRFGNLRIRQELAQHGHALDRTTAEALKATELSRARAVWQRRFAAPATDAAGRAKQARFLAARGFSAEVVRRVVSGLAEDD